MKPTAGLVMPQETSLPEDERHSSQCRLSQWGALRKGKVSPLLQGSAGAFSTQARPLVSQ